MVEDVPLVKMMILVIVMLLIVIVTKVIMMIKIKVLLKMAMLGTQLKDTINCPEKNVVIKSLKPN